VAFVGTGHRAELYVRALLGPHAGDAAIVALCDTNPGRIDYYRGLWVESQRPGRPTATDPEPETVPLAVDDEAAAMARFEQMLTTRRPDVVVVCTIDRTHARYVVAALDHGCDVICEKPLTTDVEGCRAIVEAAGRAAGRLIVTMNYRYSPRNAKVKELVAGGAIGEITSVHFEWPLDTTHGADYFRRWHRQRANSGGLLVHKSSHHFDLINWWLDDRPQTVTAHASLRFYGSSNAKARGLGPRPERSSTAFAADPDHDDPFAIDLTADRRLQTLYLDSEHHDGYVRDGDVFGPDIDIDDNMAVLARYRNGALLTYSLVAHAPWEGYRAVLNGTEGRIELDVVERAATLPPGRSGTADGGTRKPGTTLTVQRHWGPAESVDLADGGGSGPHAKSDGDHEGGDGHGGADGLLLADLFGTGDPTADPFARQAGHLDGIYSVLTGIAANTSARTGTSVDLDRFGIEAPQMTGAQP
jgi:predicted dehydrogenase